MPKDLPPSEKRILLQNVSWQQFEQLLSELGAERQTRLTYWRGKLEMMTPVAAHERCHKLLESLILVMVDELRLHVESIAPATLKDATSGYATEPDACYYFETTAVEPRRRSVLDLSQDQPPDLVVEVALSKHQIDPLPIYARFGVPEVWQYITQPGDDMLKGKLVIYQLQDDDRYLPMPRSEVFSMLPADRILLFLEESDSISLAASLRLLRAWVQERL